MGIGKRRNLLHNWMKLHKSKNVVGTWFRILPISNHADPDPCPVEGSLICQGKKMNLKRGGGGNYQNAQYISLLGTQEKILNMSLNWGTPHHTKA